MTAVCLSSLLAESEYCSCSLWVGGRAERGKDESMENGLVLHTPEQPLEGSALQFW